MTELEEERLRNQSLRAELDRCQNAERDMAELRARVEALPIDYLTDRWIDRASVLALFDGGGDE